MKKSLTICLLMLAMLVGCQPETRRYKKSLEVRLKPAPQLVFNRYEEVLFNMDTVRFQQELLAVQEDYGPFLGGDLSDPEAVKYLKDFAVDPVSISLYRQVKADYPDLERVQELVGDVYQHFNYYYPEIQLPQKIFTCVSGVSPEIPSVLLLDDALVISLDWYLDGAEVYDKIGLPKYLSERTRPETLAKDVANLFYERFVQESHRQTNLLEEMVYVGKRLFFIEAMCPSVSDETLLGYSDGQMQWAKENEGNVWADIVGNQKLYVSDFDAFRTFFADGPFTNEYSHEAPSRLGEFLGLQILRSYMDNHDCSLVELMQNNDLQGLFLDSKYKPKKS